MQLHSMTVQALGPFAGRFTVDVAALGADGLFLLEGPTGAGKSTLIDAVVFGLYGKVASDATSDDRLRSAFAAACDETFVDLVFEVGAGVFRVRRTPTYTRPKQRGPGTTTAQATARLWRLPADWAAACAVPGGDAGESGSGSGTGSSAGSSAGPDAASGTEVDPLTVLDQVGEPLATRIDEVGHRIVSLVGLERTQFVQTVVLPQGEFARFLRAKPEERRVLLQRIFGTQVYERLADRLAELRRDGDRSVAAARATLLEAAAHLVGAARLGTAAAGPVPSGGPPTPGPTADSVVPGHEASGEPVARGGPTSPDVVPAGPEADLRSGGDLVATVAGLVPTGVREASSLVGDVQALVEPVAVACAQAATTTREQADQARTAAEQATAGLAAQEQLEARLLQRDQLRARAVALEADAEVQAGRMVRLAAARSAQAVAPLLTRLDTARSRVGSATGTAIAACDAAPGALLACAVPDQGAAHAAAAAGRGAAGSLLQGVGGAAPGLGAGPASLPEPHEVFAQTLLVRDDDPARPDRLERAVDQLVAAHTTAVGQVAALDVAVRCEAGLHDAHVAAEALTGAVTDALAALSAADALAAARPAARATLADQVAQARTTAAGTAAAEQALTEAQALVTALDDLTSARAERTGAQEALTTAQQQALEAVADETRLRQARIAGLAGELAAGLTDDVPCPVCGAVEHPAPAALAHDHVDAARVDRAEATRRAREQAAADQAQAVARLDGQVTTLAARVADQTPETAADALTRATTDLALCRAAADRAAQGESTLVTFDAETVEAENRRRTLADQHHSLAAAAEVAADRLARDETTVAQARGDHPTVAARQEAASLTAASAMALADALRDLASAWAQADQSAADLAEALAARDLPSAEAARAALLSSTDLADLERAVVDHDVARAQVAAALTAAEEQLAELPEDVTADAQAARTRAARTGAEAARTDADAAEGRAAVALQVHPDVAVAADQVLAAARTVAAAVSDNAPVVRMAGLVSGHGADNARHLSLATYVLQRRFADVTAAANDRLAAMSDGRYALVPSQVKEDVAARTTGLAMRVVDHWTGTQRDPRTLSGGEAFYVSLCLALGLADTVGAESGGIGLGTLFVDEGFGSLDDQVLDQVLAELSRLRAGGRTVGIVSHVETLKQAISDRVEVRITPEGPSTLRVVV